MHATSVPSNPKDNARVSIEMADNGVVVRYTCSHDGDYEEEMYVYKNLQEALKEIPSMFSVMEEKADDDIVSRTASGKAEKEKKEKMRGEDY